MLARNMDSACLPRRELALAFDSMLALLPQQHGHRKCIRGVPLAALAETDGTDRDASRRTRPSIFQKRGSPVRLKDVRFDSKAMYELCV